jgi:uncharacterized Rossmann fold enzyme
MLHICCVRAGELFPPEYVNILHDSVRRNLADGFEGDFTCFTDQPDVLDGGIKVRPLAADLPGWWSKLALHKSGVFPDGDRVLYLDLACVITGRLDEIAAYKGPFAVLQDVYRPDGIQSGVMAWEAGKTTDVWETYKAAGCPLEFEINNTLGDQAWIESIRNDTLVRLQHVFPECAVSFKLIDGPPSKASIVCFHGYPKPHDIVTGWVPEVWKVGGMSRAALDVFCNTIREKTDAHVRAAMHRDLPWLDTKAEHEGHVCIVGGGPSLADTIDELKWRKSIGQRVWALNGAGKFLLTHGIVPDAILIVDARPENIKFLDGLDDWATVYLASQCHPSLFAWAEAQDVKVILWHANTPGMVDILGNERERPVHLIGGGTTVGMNAMVIAFTQGYRKIHLYGYDSSYRDGDHHAYDQKLNDNDRIIDALYRDKKFKVASWMKQQVDDFQELVPGLVADGCIITVAGDGLLPTVAADMVDTMPPTPAQVRAGEVLKRMNGALHPRGAEVGVFAGEMSAALLRENRILHLDMIDSWEADGKAYQGDSGDWHTSLSQSAQDMYREAAITRTEFAKERRTIMQARSTTAAACTPERYDFVFLDGDHSYEGCKADIEAWASKVKPGGWLGGHDYGNPDWPKFGVKRAVDEYVAANNLKLDVGEQYCWFVKC